MHKLRRKIPRNCQEDNPHEQFELWEKTSWITHATQGDKGITLP